MLLAERPHLAFAETLLRQLDLQEIGSATLAARSLVRVEVVRDLRLAAMHGTGLRRMRATAAMVQGPCETTWRWSRALHDHRDNPDGIRYRARHDDDEFSIAVFARSVDALEVRSTTPLLDPLLAAELGAWLDR